MRQRCRCIHALGKGAFMKKVLKMLGLITFVVIIAFSMIACNDRAGDDDDDTVDTGGGETSGPIYGGRGNG